MVAKQREARQNAQMETIDLMQAMPAAMLAKRIETRIGCASGFRVLAICLCRNDRSVVRPKSLLALRYVRGDKVRRFQRTQPLVEGRITRASKQMTE